MRPTLIPAPEAVAESLRDVYLPSFSYRDAELAAVNTADNSAVTFNGTNFSAALGLNGNFAFPPVGPTFGGWDKGENTYAATVFGLLAAGYPQCASNPSSRNWKTSQDSSRNSVRLV